MPTDPLTIFAIYLAVVVFGLLLEVAVARFHDRRTRRTFRKRHFVLARYLFFMVFLLAATAIAASMAGWTLLKLFIIFAIVGTGLEVLLDWSYEQIVGRRLWTYYSYSIRRYSSWLAVPLWGLCGGLFWLLARIFA